MDLNGSFSAAILEPEARGVHLLIDPVGGIHHLHYAARSDSFVFATAVRQILATGLVSPEPDEGVAARFFAHGFSLPPNTFFRGIGKVAPGTSASYSDGGVAVRRLHTFAFQESELSESEQIERFEQVLERATALRSEGPSEVGTFLSGGLDSSVNVGLLSRVCGPDQHSFSVAYPQERFDESAYAREVAQHNQTQHHELVLDSDDLLDELPTIVWHLEEPNIDFSYLPTYALARFTRQVTDTVISGDAPDHWLGRHYPMAVARGMLGRVPGGSALAGLAFGAPGIWERLRGSRSGRHLWKALRAGAASPVDAYLSIYEDIVWNSLSPARRGQLLMPELLAAGRAPWDGGESTLDVGDLSPMNQMIALDVSINGAFGVFAKVGKMVGAHGLTVREPYMDRDVWQMICSLPDQLKVRGSRRDYLSNRASKKYILRKVAEKLVPESVLTKPKHGFEAPVATWLRGRLPGVSAQQLLPNLADRWIRPQFAQTLIDEHAAGAHDHSCLLLMLITSDLWFRVFIQEQGSKPDYTWREYLAGQCLS